MQFTVTSKHLRAIFARGPSLVAATIVILCIHQAVAKADGAYINQARTHQAANDRASAIIAPRSPSQPLAVSRMAPYAPGSVAFAATPENTAIAGKSLNFAQTLEVGRSNTVAQFQAGQNNLSNVGVVGGSGNTVGVLQGGNALSNLYLVNTKGLSVGVLQPKGSAPSNVLIARLPSGALLIKK